MREFTKKYRILQFLKKQDSTSKIIAKRLNIDRSIVTVYLSEFYSKKIINKVGNQDRFTVWSYAKPEDNMLEVNSLEE